MAEIIVYKYMMAEVVGWNMDHMGRKRGDSENNARFKYKNINEG